MERLPRRTPAAQMDIVGLVFDALATMVEDIPIIGDIVGFVASLFGNSSASNARIARLETIVSKGSSGYDDFNRSDTSSLGRGPQMTADWVTGGDGQALGVQGRAAGLVEAALPADGRRWARYPTPASSSTMTADTIVDDKKVDNRACTSVIVAANAAFTEFVYANVFGTGVYLGRGTRSGNSWSFTDWKQNTSYKVGTAERVEVRASGSGIYQLVVDNTVILEHTDTTYPIDVDHRYVGFAIQCSTGILQLPEYGWRLSAFSLKSEAGTFTAIEAVETVANGAATTANGAVTVANGAQTAAENAVGTAVTQATAAANAAAAAAAAANTLAVQQVRSEIVKLADNIPTVDSWVSMVPGQQVSFPISLLNLNVKSIDNKTGSTSSSGSHAHSIGSRTAPTYRPASNVVEGVWIKSTYSAGRATVSFFITAYVFTTPPAMYVYFGRMTETGDLKIDYVSPNQAPTLTNSAQLVTVTAPADVLYAFDEWMYVGIHQVGSGACRDLYCIETPALTLDPDSFPRQQKIHFTSSSVLTEGSTLPKASQLYTSPLVPWVGIGVRLRTGDPLPRSGFDPFDDQMTSDRWTTVAFAGVGGPNASGGVAKFSGTTNGTQRALFKERMAYDDIVGEWGVVAPSSQIQSYVYHSDSGGKTYMSIEHTSTSTTICRFVNGARTVLAPIADTPDGVAYRVTVGLVDGKEVHLVEKKAAGTTEWVPAVSYTEPTAGALGTRGSGFRYGGIEVRRGGFAVNSGGFDYWSLRDNVVLTEEAA